MKTLTNATQALRNYLGRLFPGKYVNQLEVVADKTHLKIMGPAYTKQVGKHIPKGTQIPIEPLKVWVRRKLSLAGSSNNQAAWNIKRYIWREGSNLPKSPYSSKKGLWADKLEVIKSIVANDYVNTELDAIE